MIAIVDYGMGNIHSVQKALELCGAKTLVTNKPKDIKASTSVVLPGVGAFDDAMQELKNQDLALAIVEHIKSKKIFLGICLGMQILFETSEEAKNSKGLGIFKGSVKLFTAKKDLKVPHMGWNQLKVKSEKEKGKTDCPLLIDIPENPYVYFCHSYYPEPQDKEVIAATTPYALDFASVVWRDNVYGVQFHPEKSQDIGLKIIKNFVKLSS